MTIRQLNVIIFISYGVLTLVASQFSTIRLLATVIAVLTLVVLPAINLVAITITKIRYRVTPAEFAALAALTAVAGLPTLLLLEYLLLRQLYPVLPLLNAAAIGFLAVSTVTPSIPLPTLSRGLLMTVIRSPLTWIVVVQIALNLRLTTAFLALPDIDPYKWANWYTLWLNGPHPSPLPGRPLFYFFTYLFTPAAHLDHYLFLKYLFPFLPLTILLPAWLVASHYRSRALQVGWLLLPLFTPATILYLALPIPQSLLIMVAFFALYFSVYSYLTKKFIFSFVAGVSLAIAILFHQAAIIIFGTWLLATMGHRRTWLWQRFKQGRVVSLLGVVVLLFVLYHSPVYSFLIHWLNIVSYLLIVKPNWYFPALYQSIDGQSVGWPGFGGVVKYYGFYVGPAVLGGLLGSLLLTVSSPRYRHAVKKLLTSSHALWPAILGFAFFFTLSEILPRVSSLALLPERSWIFGSIFSGWLLLLMSQQPRKIYLPVTIMLTIAVAMSVAGAIYINDLKAHTIPDYQVRAAEWIKKNLPGNRIMLSSEQPYLLTTNAQSTLLPIDATALCNRQLTDDAYLLDRWYRAHPQIAHERDHIIENYMSRLQKFLRSDPDITESEIETVSEHFITLLNKNAALTANVAPLKRRAYIFWTRPDEQNVLKDRPYVKANQEAVCPQPVLDQYPQFFTKIYDDQGRVLIWQYANLPTPKQR